MLEILQGELKLAMGNCGTQTVAEISRAYGAKPDGKLWQHAYPGFGSLPATVPK